MMDSNKLEEEKNACSVSGRSQGTSSDNSEVNTTEESYDLVENDSPAGSDSSSIVEDPDLIKYSISTWVDKFRRVMLKTVLIEIPRDVVQVFRTENDITDIKEHPLVIAFCKELDSHIKCIGGTAFIKNNWHAPKDAVMFSLNHLLKVTNSYEALLYLYCSNIIMRDFDRELGALPFYIVFRPWVDIHPATEFRCIVVAKKLVAITPREWPKFYEHFSEVSTNIINTIKTFYENNIRNIFQEQNFIFDVQMPTFTRCYLWDFSPLNESTMLYAFCWQEIKQIIEEPNEDRSPVFRFLEEDTGILPCNTSYEHEK